MHLVMKKRKVYTVENVLSSPHSNLKMKNVVVKDVIAMFNKAIYRMANRQGLHGQVNRWKMGGDKKLLIFAIFTYPFELMLFGLGFWRKHSSTGECEYCNSRRLPRHGTAPPPPHRTREDDIWVIH